METNEELIYQIMTFGMLWDWYESEDEAARRLEEARVDHPTKDFWIEKGTDHINKKCRGCGTVHCNEEYDAYGMSTGHWCTVCYDDPSIYTYRKDNYFDPDYAGERMDDED